MESTRTRSIGLILPVLLALAGIWYWRSHRAVSTPAPAPLSVQTLTIAPHMVPDIIDTAGTVVSPQTVEVRPQTDGVLTRVLIRDGQTVRAGQPLFTIDARPLRAALAQSQANLARDEALAADAADTERRYATLVPTRAIDQKSYQTAVNTARSLRATAAADRALIREAQLSLAYTVVRAPISGRAGVVQVRAGNVVSSGSTTALVTLNTGSPIEVRFALPHVQVDAITRAGGEALPVLALDPNSGRQLDRGTLRALDNAFDESSGTLTLRGRFANAGGALMPGQFVTVRVLLAEDPNTLSVPETALQQGQKGPYVYALVGGKAVVRQLAVARLVDGQAVVSKGLRTGDRIILTVPNDLREGSAVVSSSDHRATAPTATHS